jgi:hypothetical protein
MNARNRMPRSGMVLSVCLLAGAQVALAGVTAHPSSGMLQLQNVRIQSGTASQVATVSRATTYASGFRAYKDPVTGELRDQTPEEMMKDGMADLSKSASASRAAKAAFPSPGGGLLIPLDDSFLSNAVVTKDAAGHAHMQCVTGHEAAADALAHAKAGKGVRHDH